MSSVSFSHRPAKITADQTESQYYSMLDEIAKAKKSLGVDQQAESLLLNFENGKMPITIKTFGIHSFGSAKDNPLKQIYCINTDSKTAPVQFTLEWKLMDGKHPIPGYYITMKSSPKITVQGTLTLSPKVYLEQNKATALFHGDTIQYNNFSQEVKVTYLVPKPRMYTHYNRIAERV